MQRRHRISNLTLLGLLFVCFSSTWGAKPINLRHQSATSFHSSAFLNESIKPVSAEIDDNHIRHSRYQQTYQGYPVWGGEVLMHTPSPKSGMHVSTGSNMNGIVYQDLAADLKIAPSLIYTNKQAEIALDKAMYLSQMGGENKGEMSGSSVVPEVYVDDANKAHWVYIISFTLKSLHGLPAKPTYIMDAVDLAVYEQWDDIKTLEAAAGGGFGGNLKVGKLVYDGLESDYPFLEISRNDSNNECYLKNSAVIVRDRRYDDATVHFSCDAVNGEHNNIYWDADADFVNGGYSPSNDALYLGNLIKEMYEKWYNLPVLAQAGRPALLIMRVHETEVDGKGLDNAYWDGIQMTFGDGADRFYPLTTLGVAAHEIAHGFTEQHSNLTYKRQSGGLNEAFSDMAAQAAEFYVTQKNTWQIGADITKADNEALRYMDEPTKDCEGGQPGKHCSISSADDYFNGMNVHNSSGVFNKAFYLISTAPGWDTRKAFNVMLQANRFHWTPNSSFEDAACGVLRATQDLGMNTTAIVSAFAKVNIDTNDC
ncbi:MAG: M4 family metallopeptidase [Gammaproteobacteria bacterium]|nr:M4 family metallopeptidase [Gammaproteobacteria bacterium]